MKISRAKHLLLTVATMFSLFVSAVSACACSHHEPVKVETSSCHSSSHEAPAAESDSPHLETDCNCYVRPPVPAIVAKKDDKRTAVESQNLEVVELPLRIAIEFEIASAPDVPFEPPHSNYQHALLASLPSRAPPRL